MRFVPALRRCPKAGLWEHTVFGDDGKPTVTALSCLTQASFTAGLNSAAKQPNCQISNQNINAKGMTFDFSCTSGRAQTSSHIEVKVLDSEHEVSTMTTKTTMDGQTEERTSTTFKHFKSSDCGDLKPGESKYTMK